MALPPLRIETIRQVLQCKLGITPDDPDAFDAATRSLEAAWADGESVADWAVRYRADRQPVTTSAALHRMTRMGPS